MTSATAAPAAAQAGQVEATKIEWEKGETKMGFFRRFDGPFNIKEIPISNQPLRRMLRRNHEFMSRNLYFIEAFGRYLLGNGRLPDIIKAENAARNTILNTTKSINNKIAQATVLATENGIGGTALLGKVETINLPITTPGSYLFAQLIMAADNFYNINSHLWLNGVIETKAKFENESAVRTEIKKVLSGVASQYGFILNQTRAKSPEMAAKAGGHDEAALLKDSLQEVDKAADDGLVEAVASHTDGAGSAESTSTASASGKTKRTSKKTAEEPAVATA